MAGYIEARIEKDRFSNDVSIVHLANGRKFRLVHHSAPHQFRQKSTVYAAKGKFVTLSSYFSDNDIQSHVFEIAGYQVQWGDGDVFYAKSPEGAPDLTDRLYKISDDNEEAVILEVLTAIENLPECWKFKT